MRDLLLLLRAPLAASAVANLALGVLLAAPGPLPWTARTTVGLLLLAAASACLYWAGMALNDVFDRERDASLHPQRPIPSGRIDAGVAALGGGGLLVIAVVLAGLGGLWGGGGFARGALGACAVAACVLAYDGWLKRFRVRGALAMAACRVSNAFLGAYALGLWSPRAGGALLLYAGLLGLYVLGLTLLSTYEDEDAPPGPLVGSFGLVLAVPAAVAALGLLHPGWSPLGLIGAGALGLVVVLQLFAAIPVGTRRRGERTTRALLKSIWLVDLGVLLACAPAWAWLGLWFALWLLGKLGALALFAPPPRPPQPA